MTIGKRLREEREAMGLSQPKFAELAATTKQTLFSWETGKTSPGAVEMAAFAANGVDVLYVLTGQRTPPAPSPMDTKASALLDNYQHMSPEDQAALSRLADSLAQPEKKIKGQSA